MEENVMAYVISRRLLKNLREGNYKSNVLDINSRTEKFIVYQEEEGEVREHASTRLDQSEITLLTESLSAGRHNIDRLSIAYHDVTDRDLEQIAKLKLISLNIESTNITHKGFLYLLNTKLTRLNISSNDGVDSIDVLCEHPTLAELSANNLRNLVTHRLVFSKSKFKILSIFDNNLADNNLIDISK